MRRATSVWSFFASALAWFIAITLLWMPVSPWTSYPAALLARIALVYGAADWVRSVQVSPHSLQAETRIEVAIPGQTRRHGIAELVADVAPAHYAYGLPLYLALLAASRSRRFVRHAATGYLILLFPQAFSLAFDILKQIVAGAGGLLQLRVAQWQVEGVVLGYQCGALLVPTLAPVALWLWMQRGFFAAIVMDGWLRDAAARANTRP
jgi:hypothetical protein